MPRQMREGFEERRKEYEERIRKWLSPENHRCLAEKTIGEIRAVVGNDFLPVGEVPDEILMYYGTDDPCVYAGPAYFIEHAVNRHKELGVEDYVGMLDVLTDYDSLYSQDDGALVLRKEGKPSRQVIIVLDGNTGRLILYRSFFGGRRKSRKWHEISEASPVVGTPLSLPKDR